eukprot:m.157588 g.157588  ORF g.157588 m.157588 type:complete len:366 (-) comp16311_c3_seq1:4069-5166(-)
MHVVFDISSTKLQYNPGDVLFVMPENRREAVDAVLDWFGIPASALIRIETLHEQVRQALPAIPTVLTWQQLLTRYLDIQAIPKRYFFEIMAAFAEDDLEKEKLQEFTTPEGQELRYDYCNRMRRTAVEVMQDFPSTRQRIPIEYAAEMFGFMQPRAFSISSHPEVHRGEVHTTVAIVRYRTRMATERRGVYTSWLTDLHPGRHMHIWTQKSSFKLPPADKPAIFIGPGTGCAPFRSMVHHRILRGAQDTTFIFGNRNERSDFFYKDEWLSFQQQGSLTLITAFSRDQEHKVYVQQKIREHAQHIWDVLSRGAYVLLAGSSNNMPKQVREAFVDVVQQQGNKSLEEAEAFILGLERSGRYVCETWA